MVSDKYMLHDPGPPTRARLFLDQRLIPGLVDVLAGGEAVLERLAVRVRAAPLLAVMVAATIGAATAAAQRRR